MDFPTTYTHAIALLEQEEALGNPQNRNDLLGQRARRETLASQLVALYNDVAALKRRYAQLVKLPPMHLVERAAGLFALNDALFVAIDTTGLEPDADIIRITVAGHAEIVYDQIIKPVRQPGQANTAYTGIRQEQLEAGETFAEVWRGAREWLYGSFVVSYGLEFVKARLSENLAHYGLQPIPFIGEDLMALTKDYYEQQYPLKLVDVAGRIGHDMPTIATSTDRVKACRAVLQAMSEGVTFRKANSDDDDTLDDLDDHPF